MAYADSLRASKFNVNACADLIEGIIPTKYDCNYYTGDTVGNFSTGNNEITETRITLVKTANEIVLLNFNLTISSNTVGQQQRMRLYRNGALVGGGSAAGCVPQGSSTSGIHYTLSATYIDETEDAGTMTYGIGISGDAASYYNKYSISGIVFRVK